MDSGAPRSGAASAAAAAAVPPPQSAQETVRSRDPFVDAPEVPTQRSRRSARESPLDQSGSTRSAPREPICDGLEVVDQREMDESSGDGPGKGGAATAWGAKGSLRGDGDEFDVYVRAAESQRRSRLPISPPSRRGSFCNQLGVTIKRMLILQSRAPLSLACELLIPIIFVVGSIALWLIISNPSYAREDYFSAVGKSASDVMMAEAQTMLCYNRTLSGGTAISTFPECADFTARFATPPALLCAANNLTGAPVGLCVVKATARRVYAVMQYLAVWNTTRVPRLDEMIVLQWVWRMLYQSYGVPNVNDQSIESAMFSTGTLYFAPKSAATDALVAHMQSISTLFNYVYGGTYATVAEVEAKVKGRTSRDPPNWGIVQVNSMSADNFNVAIRLNATALPRTRLLLADYYVGGVIANGASMYTLSGFTTLQQVIYQHFLTNVVGTASTPEAALVMLPAPTRAYRDEQFMAYGGQFVPLILVLGFLYPVSQMTKRIVLEKELRLREAMLIMGLSEMVMYTAWFLIYLVQYAVVSLIIAVLLRVTYLPQTNFGIIFFLFFFFSLSLITMSGLIAVFFSKARLSSILAPLIYFVLAIPLFAMQDSKGSARTGVSILSPSGLAVGVKIIFSHQLAGGMTGSDMTYFRDSPTMLLLLILLFVDFLIYLVLMLYLDAVLPKQWGTPKHPLFFVIEPVRWCCCRPRATAAHAEECEDGRAEDGVFEEMDSDDANYAIRITGLRKKYRRGKKSFLAVNNLHWGMREGEISVLLGHNGAGKTTTMNMMTGMVSADGGDCYIYGNSVRHDLEKARQEIGYCPQHNILWPSMTCYEHLWYYASVKGLSGAEREEAISRMLDSVDLEDKRHYRSKMLSGGQKRKLSVAIAFVGGSRLVFLDEPTAGMDVGARRHTWGLLRTMAKHHSILLSTHFMDEADLLGDSIAIMSKGRLQCAGSNMFLKSRLGVGYVLTLSVVAHVHRPTITDLVKSFVPSATPLGSGAGEIGFRLPMETKATFPALLTDIENRSADLGINAYSVSATTLEEIFIQIAQQEEAKEEAERKRQLSTAPDEVATSAAAGNQVDAVADLDDATGLNAEDPSRPSDVWSVELLDSEAAILYSQFKAMLWKRLWNALRDRRTQFFQIVCPVLCVLLAMLLMLVKLFQSPTIQLSSGLYGTPVEIDVTNCGAAMNLSIPFAAGARTVPTPSDVTSIAGLSSYMLYTYGSHSVERYSGLVCRDTTSFPLPNTTTVRPASAVIYNTSALHSSAIGVYDLYNGYYMAHRGNDARVMATEVQTMPRTKAEDEVTSAVYALIISIIIMIPFTFIPSTFVSWVVKERECKARHLQNVSGLFFSVYWFTNFLFDLCCYIITMFLVIIVFACFSRKEYVGTTSIGATIVLFFLYGLSGVAMAYAISFLFNEHSSAQNVVMLANFIAGFLLVLCVSMLSIVESTKNVANVLRWIFRVVPSYCVGEGIGNLARLRLQEAYGTDKTPWSMSVIGWPCLYMAIEVPFYIFITLFVDHPGRRQRAQRLFHNPDEAPEVIEGEDVDVVAERTEVLEAAERQSDLVRVQHLRKVYPNGKVAVRNITFGVRPGEVFGFLGTNGAGKTTAISILCQEFYPTSGHAAVCGHDIVKESREALRCIGYCPQFDATIDLLSVKEHLELYAGVRAIAPEQRSRVVKGLLSLCELKDYKDTLAHKLSGGNRRKLSVAISLIGGPRVVFLDEPSAGMDPVARRGLWTAIETVADNCSVVLTTHHLEEVEALAHRVAIMVDGTLQCIGNKTHLKHKYGTGFEVNVRIHSDETEVQEAIRTFFSTNFPGSSLREYRARRFTFELPGTTLLSRTFALLEEHATSLGVTDYSVSQTSIEQVFLQISEEAERRHEAEEEERLGRKKKACCSCCC